MTKNYNYKKTLIIYLKLTTVLWKYYVRIRLFVIWTFEIELIFKIINERIIYKNMHITWKKRGKQM